MLTEPVGPRSPDEILAVVYHRTERARRRRRQQMGAVAAVLAFGMAGLLSLRSGEDEASRVRVVDRNDVQTEEAANTSGAPPTTTTPAPTDEGRRSTPTTAAKPRQQEAKGGSDERPQAPTATTPAPLPTTTTLPGAGGADVRTLAQASDPADDAVLPGWYYDIVSGSMQLDLENDLVVFTTRYATPAGSGDRDDRTLESEFEFERDYVTVTVTETDNTLGTVHLVSPQSSQSCSECGKAFDPAAGLLRVTVPFDFMNDYLQRHYGNGKTIEQAADSVLHLVTVSAEFGVKADETEGAQ